MHHSGQRFAGKNCQNAGQGKPCIETYPGWLELPLTGTNFHGPKPVRATEVLLY